MIELSDTDGIVVLHHGKIIYGRYLYGVQPHTLHVWASVSKSTTGTIAGPHQQRNILHIPQLMHEKEQKA
jgi:hypothetical protein